MADRDIEQAADLKHASLAPTSTNATQEEPAAPGDTIQLDPAVMEAAIDAAAAALCESNWKTCVPHRRDARDAVRAAAAVIVPATAEQAAAAIEKYRHQPMSGTFAAGVLAAEEIARRFATTGGDSE